MRIYFLNFLAVITILPVSLAFGYGKKPSDHKIMANLKEHYQDFIEILEENEVAIPSENLDGFRGFMLYSNDSELYEEVNRDDFKSVSARESAGLCVKKFDEQGLSSRVYINKRFIRSKTGLKNYLRTLVYHELLHCLLNAGHSEIPESIMAPAYNHSRFRYRPAAVEALVDELIRMYEI
ncbi:MAG: hypothetical protein HRU19_14445 [Pseudobacteriovorax sp.]|nr:hypothetical protein [Pseudobacteriovorax sp.]